MKLWDTIVSLLDPNLADRRKALKEQGESRQQYLDLEARVVASGIKHRAWRVRAEQYSGHDHRLIVAKMAKPSLVEWLVALFCRW